MFVCLVTARVWRAAVRWVGYGSDDDTWCVARAPLCCDYECRGMCRETRAHLLRQGCGAAVAEFEAEAAPLDAAKQRLVDANWECLEAQHALRHQQALQCRQAGIRLAAGERD